MNLNVGGILKSISRRCLVYGSKGLKEVPKIVNKPWISKSPASALKQERMLPVIEELFDVTSPNYHLFNMYC